MRRARSPSVSDEELTPFSSHKLLQLLPEDTEFTFELLPDSLCIPDWALRFAESIEEPLTHVLSTETPLLIPVDNHVQVLNVPQLPMAPNPQIPEFVLEEPSEMTLMKSKVMKAMD